MVDEVGGQELLGHGDVSFGLVLGIAPTGIEVSFDVIDIVRITDGQIREHWNVVDALGLITQLGAA